MLIPFLGPSSEARSSNADAQRTVNCYLELSQKSAQGGTLYGTPGLETVATVGNGPIRGMIANGNFWYVVSGSNVYRIAASDYSVSLLGTITTNARRVGMATNGSEILIVDGVSGWIAENASLTQIADTSFPFGVTQAVFIDGYFIVAGNNSQRLYWSEIANDGASWNALDFASAEGSPDNIVSIIADHRELWVLGSQSVEVWVNTGDADQLFARSGNAFIEHGCAATWSAATIDNSVFWLGTGKNGHGIVFRTNGYTPARISTHPIETAIRGYSRIDDAFGYAFQMDGHSFYVLTFPTADATWMFDVASGEWSEWLWRDASLNTLHRHRSNCFAFGSGVPLVGDWENGKVYRIDPDVYTDDGVPIKRIRRAQTITEEGKRLFFEEVLILMETGVGLPTGQGSEPLLMLRYSNDGGHTWSNEKTTGIGVAGEYGKRVKFGPTGAGRERVWEISFSDPCKFVVLGASVRATAGS
jgi:hypothetical protein